MLTPWKKSYDQPRQHIKKQRHYFANKDLSNQSYGFSRSHLQIWDFDPEHWIIDAFEVCCWRRFLRFPWTARRSNLSILKEISSKYSLEWLMLKLKVQYFGHPMWRSDSLEKTLMLGKLKVGEEDNRGWDGWMASLQGSLACCSPWSGKESDTTEQLNWTEVKYWVKNIWINNLAWFCQYKMGCSIKK